MLLRKAVVSSSGGSRRKSLSLSLSLFSLSLSITHAHTYATFDPIRGICNDWPAAEGRGEAGRARKAS